MSLESNKTLGGIGAILMVIGFLGIKKAAYSITPYMGLLR